MKAAFLVNARATTLIPGFTRASRCGGYLFPPDAATENVRRSLRGKRRSWVLSDNGAYEEIGRIVTQVGQGTGGAHDRRLLEILRSAAGRVDTGTQLREQLSVFPDAIIGPEDVTLAVWLRAKIDEEALRRRRREIARRNVSVVRRSQQISFNAPSPRVLPVASAHDYDTAFDAGRVFAQGGMSSAAMGFGAYMADDRWTDTAKIGGRLRRLPRALPQRYVRTALAARGFFDGWASSSAQRMSHFHFLGLGAPIMVPIAILAAESCDFVTFDATSPIRDAVGGSIYVGKPASLTVRTWNVVERLLSDNHRWTCPCDFCESFTAAHPFNLTHARRHRSNKPVTSVQLRARGRLATDFPLFRMGTDALSGEAELARIGHNHWVLGGLATKANHHRNALENYVGAHVDRYTVNAGARHFGEAVQLAFDIVRPTGPFV